MRSGFLVLRGGVNYSTSYSKRSVVLKRARISCDATGANRVCVQIFVVSMLTRRQPPPRFRVHRNAVSERTAEAKFRRLRKLLPTSAEWVSVLHCKRRRWTHTLSSLLSPR
jgi:hypothetical protein